jgi:hypothetical protein
MDVFPTPSVFCDIDPAPTVVLLVPLTLLAPEYAPKEELF